MAKKSLTAHLYSEYKKTKRQREQQQFQLYRDQLKADERSRRESERAQATAAREAERRMLAERRAAEQEQKRRDVALKKQQRDAELVRLGADAAYRTEAVVAQVEQLERIIRDRDRGLGARSAMVEQSFNAWGPAAFERSITDALAQSRSPVQHLGRIEFVAFRPESRELFVDCELPTREVVPTTTSVRFVKTRSALEPQARSESAIKALYAETVARVALRTLRELFDVSPMTLVSDIVLNCSVTAVDTATGKPVRPCVLSVGVAREDFDEFRLDEPGFQPSACLKGPLRALVSPHPFDLEPVRPVLQFDLTKFKIDATVDVLAGLDGRLDLLQMTPTEFEHLVRRLAEGMGMKAWVTQASNDDGVDAVAYNESPLVGGLCVIQAKRYSKAVRHEAIQALAGVIDDKRASRGILMTTSWVGRKGHEFAARHGRMDIFEGRQLKSMLLDHLGVDALIGLPVQPPGWSTSDIA